MATNLNPATATFGTSNLVGETNDIFPSATWAQMAHNTGFNWYTTRHLATQTTSILRTASTETVTNRAYMAAGTYICYASSYMDLEGAASQGSVTVAGTTIIALSDEETGWYTGSANVIIETTDWYSTNCIAVGAAGNKTTVKWTSVMFHRGTSL